MSDRVFYSIPSDTGLLNTSADSGVARGEQTPNYIGYVEDIILDHLHPDYSRYDGSNVGNLRARIIGINQGASINTLDWVRPLNTSIQEYPLLGEMVQIFKINGDFFYTKSISLANRIQENAMLNLGRVLEGKTITEVVRDQDYISSLKHSFGNYFKPDSRVRKLKHFEGDVIFQGRMGQSIRFGSSQIDPSSDSLAPNIILRAGQGKGVENSFVSIDAIFGLTIEDINKDPSSIWMTSDQTVPFIPSTVSAGSFVRSIKNPPQSYNGANIILNSDRVVINSKDTSVLLFANESIHLNSFSDTTIDTDNNVLITANLNIENRSGQSITHRADNNYSIFSGNNLTSTVLNSSSFISNKIFIGSLDEKQEPVVGGTSLSIFLARLILALVGNPTDISTTGQNGNNNDLGKIPPLNVTPGIHQSTHVITPMGPGLLSPVVFNALVSLYNELKQDQNDIGFSAAPFNSRDNFTILNNVDPELQNNNFVDGEQMVVDKNSWNLSDNKTYKVV